MATKTVVDPVIYCGPSLPVKYGLRQYAVFREGIPGYVSDLVAKCSAIGQLIVPVANLVATRQALAKTGSRESVMFETIKEAF